jgi:hypothetical protein
MDRVSIALILGFQRAEMKFQEQISQLLSCSEREDHFTLASAVRAGLETHCLCITLTQPPLLQYHDL